MTAILIGLQVWMACIAIYVLGKKGYEGWVAVVEWVLDKTVGRRNGP